MLLVDSSVWIDHLRVGDDALVAALNDGRVLMHPHVVGEIALGSLRDRATIVGALRRLPAAIVASDDEVSVLIETRELWGRGIGYTDAHLIASTLLTPGSTLWTRDRRLHAAAGAIGAPLTPAG